MFAQLFLKDQFMKWKSIYLILQVYGYYCILIWLFKESCPQKGEMSRNFYEGLSNTLSKDF